MSDSAIEQKLLEYLTPDDSVISTELELNSSQLDGKIMILNEQQNQIIQILKINYWTQISEIVNSGNYESGMAFLTSIRNTVDMNLFHHLSKIYSLRKLFVEYDYARRNILNYAII
jgi:hypothetical protein